MAWARGLTLDAVVAGLESVSQLAGRLEAVDEGQDFDVRIDQARTGAELQQALRAVRDLGAGRIHCVLGAEGLQDRMVRLSLAQAAEAGADRVILTTDNPRSEDPNQILDDLLSGFRRPGRVRIEPDRGPRDCDRPGRRPAGDAVLLAGKGRQTYQILADRVLPFDDGASPLNCRVRQTSVRRTSA